MILAILQARMSSSRFPGKVLEPLLGVPMLIRQVDRARRARCLDDLVVATSVDTSDDAIVQTCKRHGINCERGSLDDVLDRYYRIAEQYRADAIVRLTGDCPLLDPVVIDEMVATFCDGRWDYVSNTLKPSYPDGLDAEVFSYAILERTWREAKLPSEREHVTPYMKQRGRFRIKNYAGERDLSGYRWTVDEPEDLELVSAIYAALYPNDPHFDTQQVLDFLSDQPSLLELNCHIGRDEGYISSLQCDARQEAMQTCDGEH